MNFALLSDHVSRQFSNDVLNLELVHGLRSSASHSNLHTIRVEISLSNSFVLKMSRKFQDSPVPTNLVLALKMVGKYPPFIIVFIFF